MHHILYKVTNKITGSFYIGMHSTDNLNDGYIGSGKRLKYSLKKYDKENFTKEIICNCESRDILKQKEFNTVNQELLDNPLCLNLKLGGEGGSSKGINKGKTKDNHCGVKRTAEKLTGRTKETHSYLLQAAEKHSQTVKGRNKENHDSIRRMAETMSKRNKETHDGVYRQSVKITGRTKDTHEGVRRQSEKLRKVSEEQEDVFLQLKNNGYTINEIRDKLNLNHIPYQTIVTACRRAKLNNEIL